MFQKLHFPDKTYWIYNDFLKFICQIDLQSFLQFISQIIIID